MAGFFDDLLGLLGKESQGTLKQPQKKLISLLLLVVAAGVVMVFLNGLFFQPTAGPEAVKVSSAVQNTPAAETERPSLREEEKKLAAELAGVLQSIAGVGRVEVRVNLSSSSEYEYAFNSNTSSRTTEEKDQRGGVRTVTETSKNGQLVVVHGQGSNEDPVVVREVKPEILGVLVVAEGAKDPAVKREIVEAVRTYLHLPVHRINVQPMEKR
ncbi:MAG: stage sporulation protein [Eubacteriales bacterium]|nr:stage sporulation protein [Eubacteriales bacterium]